jgi:thioester reductase-like protein
MNAEQSKLMADGRSILITGSDGYVGSRLAIALWSRTNESLHLWVRAENSEAFRRKLLKLASFNLEGETDNAKKKWTEVLHAATSSDKFDDQNCMIEAHPRLTISYGELTTAHPFSAVRPETISSIVHSAAITRFNVEAELAQATNVDGSKKVCDFARSCSNLKHLILVSSVYASGLQDGIISESPLGADNDFANHYEHSKWLSERQVIEDFNDLPWKIARVATIVADDISGTVSQQNAVHNTLKLFYYGMLSIVPGTPESPLYFVTGDFVTNCLLDILRSGQDRSIYHVAHDYSECFRLEHFIDTAFESFSTDESFKKRGILPPLYSEYDSFKMLADSMVNFGQSVMSQASGSISPFARQLYVDKRLSNQRLRSLVHNYEAPDMKLLVERMCEYLVKTKWGRLGEGGINQTEITSQNAI